MWVLPGSKCSGAFHAGDGRPPIKTHWRANFSVGTERSEQMGMSTMRRGKNASSRDAEDVFGGDEKVAY